MLGRFTRGLSTLQARCGFGDGKALESLFQAHPRHPPRPSRRNTYPERDRGPRVSFNRQIVRGSATPRSAEKEATVLHREGTAIFVRLPRAARARRSRPRRMLRHRLLPPIPGATSIGAVGVPSDADRKRRQRLEDRVRAQRLPDPFLPFCQTMEMSPISTVPPPSRHTAPEIRPCIAWRRPDQLGVRDASSTARPCAFDGFRRIRFLRDSRPIVGPGGSGPRPSSRGPAVRAENRGWLLDQFPRQGVAGAHL